MNKDQIAEWFYTDSISLTASRIFLIMMAALCIASVIYLTYWLTYRGVAYNAKFNLTNMVTLLIAVVVMLMISSNIVISLGMVGALSIVRFRTAVKDPRDTIFIFWAVAEGLCVGSQNFKLAIVTTLVIAVVMLIFQWAFISKRKYLVVLRGGETLISMEKIFAVMNGFTTHIDIRTSNRTATRQEIIIELRTKRKLDNKLSDEILKVPGVTAVNWLVENGDTVG